MSETPRRVSAEANFQPGIGRGGLIGMGVLSLVLGALSLAFPFWATIGVELIMGVALIVIGIVELVRARSLRLVARTGWATLFGVLAILAGALMLFFPLEGAITLTLVLAVFFLVGGALKSVAAWQLRPAPGWGWMMTSGVLSLVLGLLVLLAFPGSAFWVLGVLLGIDLVLFGAAQLAFATAMEA